MGCKGTYVQNGSPCMGCPDCDYVAKVGDLSKHREEVPFKEKKA